MEVTLRSTLLWDFTQHRHLGATYRSHPHTIPHITWPLRVPGILLGGLKPSVR